MENNTENNVTQNTPAPTGVEKKICPNCNAEIDKKAKVCPNCGKKFGLPTWALVLIIVGAVVLTLLLGVVGCATILVKKTGQAIENSITNTVDDWDFDDDWDIDTDWDIDDETQKDINKKVKIGEKFTFEDLEITLGDYTMAINNDKYSEHYQEPIVKIPITVKNIKNDTNELDTYDTTAYGSKGTELDSILWDLSDPEYECIYSAGSLRAGAEYTKYYYTLYDGDGLYSIEFEDIWNDVKITVDFNVKK